MLETLRKPSNGGETGFALVELVVVMIILGILAAIAVPSYLSFRDRENASAARADLRKLAPSIKRYFSDNGTYAGMTPTALQRAYDQSIKTRLYSLTSLSATSYCAKATVNGVTAYLSGPSGHVTTTDTACP